MSAFPFSLLARLIIPVQLDTSAVSDEQVHQPSELLDFCPPSWNQRGERRGCREGEHKNRGRASRRKRERGSESLTVFV